MKIRLIWPIIEYEPEIEKNVIKLELFQLVPVEYSHFMIVVVFVDSFLILQNRTQELLPRLHSVNKS